ncbi:MAG: imidazole glycerol-phosphate synthase subunit HisH [Gammaproteobacteria bacterium]|jgi:glutamine amidotransferase|nr:imidazole glycerol-phosphate synthase subunit HisH [Gammaproteobacteria bacterium]
MNASNVVIVANGGANIASLQFALERLNVPSMVSGDPEIIGAASHVILPGVGAAANAMARLRRDRLDDVIPKLRQPVLGICLGMQLLYESSDEGDTRCLGIIPGRATRFTEAQGRPVPHIGWNTVEIRRDSPLLAGIGGDEYAYFVHSYALPVTDATVASTQYGSSFSACVEWGNFFGAQFHPERSATVGARVLRNFLAIA